MATAGLLLPESREGMRHAARVRDMFLSEESDELPGIRSIVARSWYRSRAAGVDAVADRGIRHEGRVDEHTLRASAVHLQKLDEVVGDMGGYVSLTAPNGALVRPSFLRDDDTFPPGYSLLEESCGSTGEGVALEEGRGIWLAPEEHFREDMRGNWCFASLVRDPFHNRVRAVIGLTLPAGRVTGIEPSSTLLMLEGVASRIEHEIEDRTSSKERALLSEYLTISRRRGNAAVIALDGKNSLMNSAATDSLEDSDFSIISGYAKAAMSTGRDMSCDVILSGVGAAVLEVSLVWLSSSSVGAVVVVRPHTSPRASAVGGAATRPQVEGAPSTTDDRPLAGLDGTSAEFRNAVTAARRAAEQSRSVSIVGEPGSGKRRLADAIASLRGDCITIEAQNRAPGRPQIHETLRRVAEESPHTLIIEQADELSQFDAADVVRHLRKNPRTVLVMTITRPSEATLRISEACEVLEIAVAPLRSRREDIPFLAHAIARELGRRQLSRKLITTLTNADWPRNIDQLRAVVSNAVERAQGNEVTVDDLPQGMHGALTNGRLSRLESAELSELRSALQEAKGNRRLAAEMLQIGRSTLYRRMDYFRHRGFDL